MRKGSTSLFWWGPVGLALVAFACGHDPGQETTPPPLGDDGGSTADEGGATSETGSFGDGSCSVVTTADGGSFAPASHPPAPTVTSGGGPVIASPSVTPIFFSGDDPSVESLVGNFLTALTTSTYWGETTSQYGVGALSARPGIQLAQTAPDSMQDSDVQTLLLAALNGNDPKFPTSYASAMLVVLTPSGTTVQDASGDVSCEQFGGYHSEVQLDAAHGNQTVAYVVIPRCASFGNLSGIEAITASLSHELIESSTDPSSSAPALAAPDSAHSFWTLAMGGGELADMCSQTNTSYVQGVTGFWVARSWSNSQAAAGHDPCVPAPSCGAYFNAAPVLPDSVQSDGVTVPDVHIPAGGMGTVQLDLFSDAPTTKAWQVAVTAMSGDPSQVGQLSFTLDRSSGQNGDVLNLSITVEQAAETGFEVFYVFSTMGERQSVWVGLVGN